MRTPAPGFVTGRVVDLERAPVRGARVFHWHRDFETGEAVETLARVECDETGRFRLGPIPADPATQLFVESDRHARERIDDVVVFPGHDHDLGDLVVAPGLTVTGRVRDQLDAPLQDAAVTVRVFHRVLQHTIEPMGPSWRLRTSSDGSFATPPLPRGWISLHVDAPDRERWRADHVADHVLQAPIPRTHDLGTIRLAPQHTIRGRIVDRDRRPIAGARVRADADYEHAATTDSQGRFEVHAQSGNVRQLEARARGFVRRRSAVLNPLESLEIALERAFEVTGEIVDDVTGAPIVPRGVRLGRVETGVVQGSCVLVEDGGETFDVHHFRLWVPEAGEYQVVAGADGYEPACLELGRLDPLRDVHGLVLRLRRSDDPRTQTERAPLRGRVLGVDPGTVGWASLWYSVEQSPVPNARIHRGVPIPVRLQLGDKVPLAHDGSFRFDDASGPTTLRIDLPGRAPELRTLDLPCGRESEIEVSPSPPARLLGRIGDVPPEMAGRTFVVVTDRRSFVTTVRARLDGRFEVLIPAAEVALYAGSDGDAWCDLTALAEGRDGDQEEVRRTVPFARASVRAGETLDLGDCTVPPRE